MGVSDVGNFDNDAALGFVARVVDHVSEELVPPTKFEDLQLLMGAVAVYKTLVENCNATPPDREELEVLRRSSLQVFDAEADEFYTSPKEKQKRRKVIADTYDEFLAFVQQS